MSKQKSQITDFVVKGERRKRKHDDQDTTAQRESSSDQHGDGRDVDVGATGASTSSAQEEPPQASVSANPSALDIADFLNGKVSDEDKLRLMENRCPHPQFKFPSREFKDKRKESGRAKRYCQHDWFSKFPFLCYSTKEDGLYCLPCVLFPTKPKKGARSKLLISQSYCNWKDARSDINVHSTLEYHKAAMFTMTNFSTSTTTPDKRIDHSLTERRKELVQKNRQFLKSIIKTVEICGRQGWALRGHRDEQTSSALNKGNFKALLDFRVDAGDNALAEHLQTAPLNAVYTSAICQNDLLLCIKEYIQGIIISEVKAQPLGPFYTVEADEVTDIANWEQLAIVIRYLKGNKPIERLVGYVACDSITGEEICRNILDTLTALGLNPQDCRGQTYDGAGNMAGKERGCAARFQEVSPRAHYHHCSSHSLNLALSKACSVTEITLMLSAIKSTGLFFEGSPKRSRQLEKAISELNGRRREQGGGDQIPLQKLKLLCATRWVERHTALEDFIVLYEPVLDCLDMIRGQRDQTWSSKAITEANGLIAALTSSSFVVACVCASYIFEYTKSLSVMLQGTSMDVIRAYEQITMVTDEIKAVRDDVDAEFDRLFTSMSTMAEAAGIEITVPRTCRRQTARTNVPADGSSKIYWKRAVFIPYLDGLITELSNRFTSLSHKAVRALCLLPANLDLCSDDKVDAIVQYYGPDMPSPASVSQEVRLWKRFWREVDDAERPKTVSDTLRQMNSKQFPNVCAVLQSLLLLPVTSAEVERVHSAFKIVKKKLRSTMLEDRLNALILLYFHKDIALDYDEIINIYSRKHPRRMTFLNPMEEK
ncbi:52 kDa repressor of the inhibitor of the protein kinase-like [Apostichopus japonicus]|uniref:52 kDa repressor of the inhibitor of the protein kinase-like n=1 Tax=Stichopus japonicus TaxID=307972 RepID=UPI003AB7D203